MKCRRNIDVLSLILTNGIIFAILRIVRVGKAIAPHELCGEESPSTIFPI